VLSVLAGIFAAAFAIPTAESRLTCVRDEGQQLRCDEAEALLGFWEVRKRALPGLGKEEIRSRLAEGPGIGEAEIADFVSGRGPTKVRAVKRVPLSPFWWSICGVLEITALYAILWFPIELYYWLSHRERPAG
jgi:hypothetical protein